MKNNIKRWISVLIIASVVLSLGIMPVSATVTDDNKYNQAYSLLSCLDILDGLEDPDEENNTDSSEYLRTVSRAEFAMSFSKLINAQGASSGKLYYNDVPSSHFAFNEITLMTDLGYLNGTESKKFEPDEPMKREHAMVLMLKALGLMKYINSEDADEDFIKWVIADSEIAEGAGFGEYVTFRDMVVMIFNTLLADYYELYIGGKDGSSYRKQDGKSLLYVTRDMHYEKRQLLTAANGADIYGIEDNINTVVIGGVSYESNNKDFSNLLAKQVDYVWLEDDADSVVWAIENDSREEIVLEIDEDTDYNSATGQLTYTENARKRQVNISKEASIIYNGRYSGRSLQSLIEDDKKKVLTLIASSDRNKYDVVLVESYWNMMVSDVENKDTVYVYDRNGGNKISLDENEYSLLSIFDVENNKLESSDIKKNDILSVFMSENEDIAKIIKSNATVSGKVKSVGNDNKIVIDDTTYKLYSSSLANRITVGAVITGYLDYRGYITEIENGNIQSDQFVGFILSGVYSETEVENGILLKILAEDGTIEPYVAAAKINVDGKGYKDNKAAYEAISNSGDINDKPKEQIALIKLNNEGQIVRLDFAHPDDGGTHPLTINRQIEQNLESVNQAMYTSGQGKIGTNMLVDSNTKVFIVPQNLGNDFSRCGVAKIRAWDDYRGAVSYRITQKDTFVEQYIVTRQLTYGTIGNTHPIRMVEKIYQTVNSDGDVVWMLRCTDGSSFTDYEVSEYLELERYGLEKGDIIRVAATATNDNKLEYVTIVARVNDNTPVGEANRKLPYATGRVVSGYANDRLDYYLKIGWDSGSEFDEIFKLTAATPMAVYDSELDRVYVGSIEDIKTYVVNSEASRVFAQTNEGTLQRVFVYR